jgi:8-hydroxy-5-deazaflavin:NADPH oxidoreductase
MKIGILGTGSVGQALAGRLAGLGHDVVIGTRDVETSKNKVGADGWGNPQIGAWLPQNPSVKLATYEEAAAHAEEFVIHAMNGLAAIESLKMAGEANINGKILIDITNPLDFSKGFPPSLFVSNTDSLGEQIQAAFPDLKVVKTLNTMSNPVMINPKAIAGDHSLFVSGNDAEAITTARGTEQILPIWVRLFGKLQTPMFNFNVNIAK